MTSKKPTEDKRPDSQTFLAIGALFFVLGVSMLLPETSRVMGIPFVILGATFLALSREKSSD